MVVTRERQRRVRVQRLVVDSLNSRTSIIVLGSLSKANAAIDALCPHSRAVATGTATIAEMQTQSAGEH